MLRKLAPFWIPFAAFVLTACERQSSQPVAEGMGPDPKLPPPVKSLIPTIAVAPATGWPEGATPTAAPGLSVSLFARDLDHPRWLYVLPGGDVLVAETNGPDRPANAVGFRGWVWKQFAARAGADVPSADRITLLRDKDGDGVAEERHVFLKGLHSPFGMGLAGDSLYVANTDAVLRFPWRPGETAITVPGEEIVKLPAGPRNHHWTKSLVVSPDGTKLYVGVGSNSNAAEHGMEEEEGRAAIWEITLATRQHRIFASGLRNPVGLAFEPQSGVLWAAVNERDERGNDLVPDYMTAVQDGGFYGWPYSYFGQNTDTFVEPQQPGLAARAIKPDYALGPHTASLGLAFAKGAALGPGFASGAFVGQHGSWNRRPPSGYKVIFIPFKDGKPAGMPVDVLSGFLDAAGNARGRPVGVAIDSRGGLLVADDTGNRVWRVSAAAP